MKKLTQAVESRLRKKKIAIVDYIFRLREGREMTITEMAEKMKVKTSYLSRILSGIGTNVTLETIAKCEDALDAEIIVCPGEYEERLIDQPERLWLIFSTALKTESGHRLIQFAAQDSIIKNAIFLGYVNDVSSGFQFHYHSSGKLRRNTNSKGTATSEDIEYNASAITNG